MLDDPKIPIVGAGDVEPNDTYQVSVANGAETFQRATEFAVAASAGDRVCVTVRVARDGRLGAASTRGDSSTAFRLRVVDAVVGVSAATLFAALLSPMLIGGWNLSWQAAQPDFSRMNPVTGFGRIFSKNSLVELAKSIACVLQVCNLPVERHNPCLRHSARFIPVIGGIKGEQLSNIV